MFTTQPISHRHSRRARVVAVVTAAIAGLALAGDAFAQQRTSSAGRSTRGMSVRQVVNLIEQELRDRREMKEAAKAVAEARQAYLQARGKALDRLARHSEYLRLLADAEKLQKELDAIYHRYRYGVPPSEPVRELSREIFKLRTKATEIERDIVESHQATQEAREVFLAAARELVQLEREIPDLIRADPRFEAARRRR